MSISALPRSGLLEQISGLERVPAVLFWVLIVLSM